VGKKFPPSIFTANFTPTKNQDGVTQHGPTFKFQMRKEVNGRASSFVVFPTSP
jgi:hypothetical protein